MSGLKHFHLPYNFIPVDTRGTRTESAATLAEGKATHPARHDVWDRQCQSGRILCEVLADTPIVVGGRQLPRKHKGDKEEPAVVEPYRSDGRIAIPGSTLRGMVGSLAEALSQSALRKLDGREPYDFYKHGGPKRKVPGTLYDAFRRSGGENALPWGLSWEGADQRPATRTQLTPAELLLGVVAEGNMGDDYLAALAGRVSFSDAVLPDGPDAQLRDRITLQILEAPKPKSPTFYFSQQIGHGVSKDELDLNTHSPNGRKSYVLHRRTSSGDTWQHRGPPDNLDKQRLSVTPVAAGTRFYFSIDFENLRDDELHLLLTALKPDKDFIHRLGLGKPLGLGHVLLQVKAVCRFSRAERYRATSLESARYTRVQTVPGISGDTALRSWLSHARYRDEHDAIFVAGTAIADIVDTPARLFGDPPQSLVDAQTLEIVRTLGNRNYLGAPTHYPRIEGSGFKEDKLYAWNVINDKLDEEDRQWLKPVTPCNKLPTLERNGGKPGNFTKQKPLGRKS